MSEKLGPRKPDNGNDISKHFVNGDGKLFEDTNLELPDVAKVVKSETEKAKRKYEFLKKIIIELGKFNIKESQMNLFKLAGAIIALVVAFLFVFIFPGAGFEMLVVGVIASILNAFGITSWRLEYGIVKDWYKSKTIWGALVVVIPLIALLVIKLAVITVPALVVTILYGLVVAGGGAQLIGIWLAISKAGKTETFIK